MPAAPTTLALIHGLGASRRCWDRLVPLLEGGGLRVTPVELPGYGNRRGAPPARTIESMADDVARTLSPTGAPDGDLVVVGHSMGGLVATALAERWPQLPRRIVVVNSSMTVASRLTAHRGSEGLVHRPLIGRVAWRLAPRGKLRGGLESAFAPGFPVPDVFVDDLRACSWTTFTRSGRAMDAFLGDRALPERLASLAVPSSLVYGMQDRRIDHEAIVALCRDAPDAVTRIEEAGHSPMWEAPQPTADAIRAAIATD